MQNKIKYNKNMAKKKTVAAPVNEIDEAVKESTNFLEKNKKALAYGVSAVLLVLLVGLAVKQYYINPRNVKASDALAEAQQLMNGGDFEKALTGDSVHVGFLAVIDKYSCTDAANLAHLYAAQCYFQTARYQEALDQLDDFSDCGDEMVSPAAMMMKGDCYAALDQLDKAAKAFVKAAKRADNNTLSPACLQKAAQVYEKQGDNKAALECYTTIKEKYQQSPLYSTVDKDIERLK